MGIKGLAKLIKKEAPSAVRNVVMSNYFGRVIAVDASVIIYQFLTSARDHTSALSNIQGDDTSHLSGILYRTIKFLENGIKPLYVFDGKPPKEKENELKKRQEGREKVKIELEKAKSEGNQMLMKALSKRTVKISDSHVESCKKLLDFLGVPYMDAVADAEAQCSLLVTNKIAHAVATEDMDALTFGADFLIRKFSIPKDKNQEMQEFCLEKIHESLGLNHSEFVDLCILLGCDYCDTIKGIGPGTALKLIREYKSIDSILKHMNKKKYSVPENFDYESARSLFLRPVSKDLSFYQLSCKAPNFEDLYKFLVEENNFNETRATNSIQRLKTSRSASAQSRIDSFFAPKRKSITNQDKSNDKNSSKKAKKE